MSSPSKLLKGRPTAPLLLPSSSASGSLPSLQTTSLTSEQQLTGFLLKIVGSALSNDPPEIGLEIVETSIKKLLNADRASIFLIDKQTQELHAFVFSVSNEESASVSTIHLKQDSSTLSHLDSFVANLGKKPVDIVSYEGSRVSVSINKGVIGHVARTGQLMNVKNAMKNKHFCREIDKLTGYKTENLLCTPLVVDGQVVGVIEALNKKEGTFSESDEQNIQSIALVCSLFLNYSNLKQECKRQENKYKVTNEILQYQRKLNAVQQMKEVESIPPVVAQDYNIDSFFCDTKLIPDNIKANLFVKMVSDLVDNSLFHSQQLLKFAITVSKNYRPVPYHNWDHAFHVAQFMCCILRGASAHFSDVEKLALVLSCLCHDLDHRALSNGFLVSTNHPLAQLYSNSVMENHHFSLTIELLQLEGLNVVSLLGSQYNATLGIIQKAILATDLVTFAGNKSELSKVMEAKNFSWDTPLHKDLVICLMMTLCDLCSAYKPWEIHTKSVYDIFDEFYKQGDLEKSEGFKPAEILDRKFKHKLADFEVGFIQGIAEPCCQLLTTVMPHIHTLLQTTRSNKQMWQDVSDKKIESPIKL